MDTLKRLKNFSDLVNSITIESKGIYGLLENIEDQFYRRIFLRNTFSMIETYMFLTDEILKLVIEIDEAKAKQVSWSELVIIHKKNVLLDDKGKIKLKDNFHKFEPSLRFSLDLFTRIFGMPKTSYGDKNFQKLTQLYKKRNQITHPKIVDELLITAQEIEDIATMHLWFIEIQENISEYFTEWLKNKYHHFQ